MHAPTGFASRVTLGLGIAASLLSGCSADVDIRDLDVEVIIPREAAAARFTAVRQRVDPITGRTSLVGEEVTLEDDRRAIGPVYLGLYQGMDRTSENYTSPARGPDLDPSDDLDGDAYPYGGTTVGDFPATCIQALACRVVSGRFETYDELIDFYRETVGLSSMVDNFGEPVTTGDRYREVCYEAYNITQEDEIRLTAFRDNNDDGEIDAEDLDFVEDANGDWVAHVKIWQQEIVEGFNLWGFMDSPGTQLTDDREGDPTVDPDATPSRRGAAYFFSTCDRLNGRQDGQYAAQYNAGYQKRDVLNRPSRYIDDGDWVASEAFIWDNPDEIARVVIDQQVSTSIRPTIDDDTGVVP